MSRSCSSWWGWGFSWPGPRSSSRGAVDVATALGVSGLVVGLTVVALGTSLPELSASVVAVRRGQRDLAIGNVVGNCLLNLGLVLGVPAILVDGGLLAVWEKPEAGTASMTLTSFGAAPDEARWRDWWR